MKKEELEKYLKVLELDPSKSYIFVVGKGTGLYPKDLMQIDIPNLHPTKPYLPKSFFLYVDDVNQIKAEEYESLEEFIKKKSS